MPDIDNDPTSENYRDMDLKDLLRRYPSGPDFIQPTVSYCQYAINTSLVKFRDIIARQYPAQSDNVQSSIESVLSESIVCDNSDLVVDNNALFLRNPYTGNLRRANSMLFSLYKADPLSHLGAFRYTHLLYASGKKGVRPSQNLDAVYLGYGRRFENILNLGSFGPGDPKAQIIAVSFLTQIAKNLATFQARELLKRMNRLSGIEPVDAINPYFAGIAGQVRKLRGDMDVVQEGNDLTTLVAIKHQIPEEQMKFLQDIAFLKDRAVGVQDMRSIFKPLVTHAALGEWDLAFEDRDFLLKYLSNSFPEWRSRESSRETRVHPYESIAEIVMALKKGDLTISEDKIPVDYREVFGDLIKRKIDYIQRREDARIIRDSLHLSRNILDRLAGKGGYYYYRTPGLKGYKRGARGGILGAHPYDLNNNVIMSENQDTQLCTWEDIDFQKKTLNFGLVLGGAIGNAIVDDKVQTADEIKQDPQYLTHSHLKQLKELIIEAFNAEQSANARLDYSLQDYFSSIIKSIRAANAFDDERVQEFIRNLSYN